MLLKINKINNRNSNYSTFVIQKLKNNSYGEN